VVKLVKQKGFTIALKCGYCGNVATMEIKASCGHMTNPTENIGEAFELVLCPSCKNVNLVITRYEEVYDGVYPEYDKITEISYPVEPKQVIGLPIKVSKAYKAAIKVRSIDPNAFAVLLGRVLEEVCKDRRATGKTLYERLKDLANKGEIPERLAEMAQSLRQFRNVGAHADLGELTENEIPFLDDLSRAILEYVYSVPKLVERVQRRLDEINKSK